MFKNMIVGAAAGYLTYQAGKHIIRSMTTPMMYALKFIFSQKVTTKTLGGTAETTTGANNTTRVASPDETCAECRLSQMIPNLGTSTRPRVRHPKKLSGAVE
jgi:hypothetical protein